MSKRSVNVGGVKIGGGAPVSVQSMLCVPVADISGNIAQAKALEAAGCEIIRATVPTPEDAALISALKNEISVPIVADIHFDYKAAVAAVEAGADKIRINPGNIGSFERVRAVVDACKKRGVPIRVGINGGSLEKRLLSKYGGATAEALVESALDSVALLERLDFYDIVISIKSSDVMTTIKGYRLLSERCEYPLHLGVTEAGTYESGVIKSSIGIGALLADGIGDTIRVSLTENPVREVEAGFGILKALGLRRGGVQIISCPTCGRTAIDLFSIVREVESATKNIDKSLRVAVMGCVVNGPGEASAADVGIAGGRDCAVLFKKGVVVRKIEGNIAAELISEIERMD